MSFVEAVADGLGHSAERMVEDEVDQFLALEEAGPHIVALASGDDQLHSAAELTVAALHFAGIGFKRDDLVHIAVDGKEGHSGLGQRRETVDRIVFVQVIAQFFSSPCAGQARFE